MDISPPDAFVCPRWYPSSDMDRDFARNDLFGRAMGVPRVMSRQLAFERSMVTRDGDTTTFLFPTGHPRHPEQRHNWFVSGGAPDFLPGSAATPADFATDSVLVGYLKT